MIKGLRPALAEAGKIKIGGLGKEQISKKGNKYRAPQKYSSFCLTKTTRDQDGNLIVDKELMEALPKDPDGKVRELPIVLHADDIEAVFPTSYACYGGRKLECRGDGETATRWNQQHTAQDKVECPCSLFGAQGQKTCKPHGTLHCSIALAGYAVAGAVYKWRTTSIISIQRMVGSLQQILATVGVLRGVPLRLKVEPVQVSPGNTTTTVYCCHIELKASDINQVQQEAFQAQKTRAALANGVDLDAQYKQLVAHPGLDESPDEQAEVADEFHPQAPAPTPYRDSRAKQLTKKLTARAGGSDANSD